MKPFFLNVFDALKYAVVSLWDLRKQGIRLKREVEFHLFYDSKEFMEEKTIMEKCVKCMEKPVVDNVSIGDHTTGVCQDCSFELKKSLGLPLTAEQSNKKRGF